MSALIKKIENIFDKNLAKIVLVIIGFELLSLISVKLPLLSAIFFVLILIILVLLTCYKLEYGLWFALVELMIGSQGYLFYIQTGDFRLSIRIGIFLVLFFIWLIKYFSLRDFLVEAKKSRLYQIFIIFIGFLVVGIINGLMHKYTLKGIFFDVNGYLYFGLFFVFLTVFKSQKQIDNFLKIFIASLIYISIKIFLTLYIFTHGFQDISKFFYTWIRDTRVGEITWAGGSFFRIFLQSQIYSLVAIFIIISLITVLVIKNQSKFKLFLKSTYFVHLLTILIIVQTSILISFSRSFWLGGVVGMICLFAYLIIIQRLKFKKLLQIFSIIISAGILSMILMLIIVSFPLPKPGVFTADLFKDRFKTDDAAVSSRWNLLPVLLEENKKAPILGTGFGTTITYQTEDPRIKNSDNPEGWYTTAAFEWGYLDTITEIGLLGLLVYILFISQIFWQGIKSLKTQYSLLTIGFLIGLIAILTTHAFSPYLNHPLGIGYLMITASILTVINKQKT